VPLLAEGTCLPSSPSLSGLVESRHPQLGGGAFTPQVAKGHRGRSAHTEILQGHLENKLLSPQNRINSVSTPLRGAWAVQEGPQSISSQGPCQSPCAGGLERLTLGSFGEIPLPFVVLGRGGSQSDYYPGIISQ
jgi:hypothetical protein